MYLERISSPEDVRRLPEDALPALCDEIRDAVIRSSAVVGGHVGPNLSVVELTVALHRVFSSPRDKIVFDVSHQTYPHKMLTGRAQAFLDPTRYEEVSGFASPAESEHDLFAMGHTSTSVSLACGLARARDAAGERYDVVAVVGDGALSGGLAFEGLDNAAELEGGLIVVVNDNEWSIAPNHGGIYRNLAELRAGHGQARNNLFEALGLEYRYLEDGHDVAALERALGELRGTDHPVVLHVHTRKGHGFAPAEADPETWHHATPFDAATGTLLSGADKGEGKGYAGLTAQFLLGRMEQDPRVMAVCAATPYIMGFTPQLRERAGSRFVDVGIAEEHALTFVAGLARGGARPVLGIYATFLQRAYDELWHDACLNAAPAVILVFGASAWGNTDATHLGFFDIPMLGSMPGLPYLAPTCREEYLDMLGWALDHEEGPVAIRVPAAGMVSRPDVARIDARGPVPEVVRRGSEVAVLALGDALPLGERVADELLARAGVRATLVNPRLATTPDEALLARLAEDHRLVVTLEDGVLDGGFGERCARVLAARPDVRVLCYGLPRAFLDRYDPAELLASCHMTPEGVAADVMGALADGTGVLSARA